MSRPGALFALPVSIALDRTVIPRGIQIFKDFNALLVVLLSVLVMTKILPRKVKVPAVSMEDMERFFWPKWLQNALETIKRPFVKTLVFIKLCIRVIIAKTSLLFGGMLRMVVQTLDLNPPEELDIKDWKVCVLDERENLSGGIIKYRFELPNPAATIPLYVGQEVKAPLPLHRYVYMILAKDIF